MISWFDKLRGLLLAMLRQGLALRLPQTAASLAFLSTLALVPIFSIVISVMAALPVFDRLRETLQKFLIANLFLPSIADTVVSYVNRFASNASELSLVGALAFFATAFSALLTIDRTLNQIWDTERPRALTRRITLYWTLLTLGPLLVALSLTVNGLIFSEFLSSDWSSRYVQRVWFRILPLLFTVGGLTLVYRVVPNAPVRWRDAFFGALLAGLVLQGMRFWMGAYFARLPSYTVVYGAFAVLPLFLVWLFTTWLTVLLGALCAANLRFWGSGAHVHVHWTPAQRFEAGVGILRGLVDAHFAGTGLTSAMSLRAVIGPDPRRADDTAALLAQLGFLHRHWLMPADPRQREIERAVWDEHWSLASSPESLTLRPFFESIWRESGSRSRIRDPRADLAVQAIDSQLLDLPVSRSIRSSQAVAAS